jgi:hypothetical protein
LRTLLLSTTAPDILSSLILNCKVSLGLRARKAVKCRLFSSARRDGLKRSSLQSPLVKSSWLKPSVRRLMPR